MFDFTPLVYQDFYLKHPAEDSSRKGCEALFSQKTKAFNYRLSQNNCPMQQIWLQHSQTEAKRILIYMEHSTVTSPPLARC